MQVNHVDAISLTVDCISCGNAAYMCFIPSKYSNYLYHLCTFVVYQEEDWRIIGLRGVIRRNRFLQRKRFRLLRHISP